ncbi:MAG: sigma-70 family RNA polymerase sigma factor [Nocardioidaceae bacterium]|nr:sigma-70 family RNA polymerase sigma factor [Nocardioidaceae bacterium]NUS50171.1 sigma-70 family RNA polymerase sigma factor [Nocardioidaceae bacterium]
MIETHSGGETDTLVHRAAQAFAGYLEGDRAELDRLVTLLTPLLWHTVRSQGVDRAAADDVVQTTWLRLLHSGDAIRDPQSVVKWLLTAARREAWRVTKRARADVVRTAALFGQDGEQLTQIPGQRDEEPDETVLRDDSSRVLWSHVQGLSDRCRELIRVIAFADRPDYALIADSLGMPVGSIGPTRGRCLAKLRLALAADPRWGTSEPADAVVRDPSGGPGSTSTEGRNS